MSSLACPNAQRAQSVALASFDAKLPRSSASSSFSGASCKAETRLLAPSQSLHCDVVCEALRGAQLRPSSCCTRNVTSAMAELLCLPEHILELIVARSTTTISGYERNWGAAAMTCKRLHDLQLPGECAVVAELQSKCVLMPLFVLSQY